MKEGFGNAAATAKVADMFQHHFAATESSAGLALVQVLESGLSVYLSNAEVGSLSWLRSMFLEALAATLKSTANGKEKDMAALLNDELVGVLGKLPAGSEICKDLNTLRFIVQSACDDAPPNVSDLRSAMMVVNTVKAALPK